MLSRIIPDREPAISSAEGIKTLMNCLEKTTDDDVRALAADCIARLAHTRAGSINIKSGFQFFNEIVSCSFFIQSIFHLSISVCRTFQ